MIKLLSSIVLFGLLFASCTSETYRTNKDHQLSEKAKKSHHYLAKQAHILTSENLEDRDKNVKKATKKNKKLQNDLNESNANTSKATKKRKKFSGEFNIY
jgi:PBP1b-binding outer membrane lipoprotein LpoB